MSAIAPPSFYYGSQTGSFFVGGSFAFSGVSAASSERRAARGCGCGALSRALRCPALAAALDARCAAPFRARFPEAAALLSAVPATLHASLGRNFFTGAHRRRRFRRKRSNAAARLALPLHRAGAAPHPYRANACAPPRLRSAQP
jgi:hypothetical protein